MKKFTILLTLLLGTVILGQNWTFLSQRGTPFSSYYLGDYLTDDIYFAINQDTYGKTVEFGVCKNTNGSDIVLYSADYSHQDGNNRYWKFISDNTIKFTSTGNWYYTGKFTMPSIYYASQDWTENLSILNASSYFTVNALGTPTGLTVQRNGSDPDHKIDLSWTKWNGKDVLIVRRASGYATGPSQGTSYAVNDNVGGGTVVYKGSGTSFSDDGLTQDVSYYYNVYSINNDYYSDAAQGNVNTTPVQLTKFNVISKETAVLLTWTTATEIQNYGWDIERKILDGNNFETKTNWEKIGFVSGSGNSNSNKNYSFTDKSVLFGTYEYRLKQIDLDGSFEYSDEIKVKIGNKPNNVKLHDNFPNPFNPETIIRFEVPQLTKVNLSVFNVLGEKVITLVDESMKEGIYQKTFNAKELQSGIYFYKLEIGNTSITKKMMIVK